MRLSGEDFECFEGCKKRIKFRRVTIYVEVVNDSNNKDW